MTVNDMFVQMVCMARHNNAPNISSINTHGRSPDDHRLLSISPSLFDLTSLCPACACGLALDSSRCFLLQDSMATKSKSTVVLALVMALVAVSCVWMKGAEAACPDIDLEVCQEAAVADVEPSTECCTALKTYTSTNDASCLCEAASSLTFFTTNSVEYAILIPQKCDLTYEAGTTCAGIVIPGGL